MRRRRSWRTRCWRWLARWVEALAGDEYEGLPSYDDVKARAKR